MDKIKLTGLNFYGYHGCLPSERQMGQEFIVDISMYLDLKEHEITSPSIFWNKLSSFISDSSKGYSIPPLVPKKRAIAATPNNRTAIGAPINQATIDATTIPETPTPNAFLAGEEGVVTPVLLSVTIFAIPAIAPTPKAINNSNAIAGNVDAAKKAPTAPRTVPIKPAVTF